MSWKDIIKETPEEAEFQAAKKFALSDATKGMTMEQATRLFAEKFPGQTPPNIEKLIQLDRQLDEALANLDASRKRYEESKKRLEELRNMSNSYRPE
jgi:hypothetical protein